MIKAPDLPFSLAGRKALVTGGSRGIGAAIATLFAEASADVAICHHGDDEHASALAAALAERGQTLHARECDVAQEAEVTALADWAAETLGNIDILVNCAGIGGRDKPIGDVSVEEWDRMIGVNLRGVFLVSRTFFPGMVNRGYGRIVNIASQLAYKGAPGLTAYVAAKSGVVGFTRALSYEGAPHNVMVNGIAPGPVETPLLFAHSEAWLDMKKGQLPLGRFGQPDEIAPTALLLASETGGAFYCGQTLSPNGGDVMI
ncbi:SDR family NAD(P)-dependent oxidoreductase [Oceanicola sp. 502str15]|uniref:SDR family NAD(P)-dependent oxidoreductase n=1 Tax=Oceanicola sp. 502str15 TaxID=2696061 RepID=UPI002095D03E|nr:3-oxoacyl-ACP reductase FabG [Oceanicola sp. 502str15]MCO6385185.1 SDR family oxidoreductase [Oceanicola sp. 502str15]